MLSYLFFMASSILFAPNTRPPPEAGSGGDWQSMPKTYTAMREMNRRTIWRFKPVES
jgi:hypothetical protein